MDPLRQMISDLQFKLRLKEERIEALESGEAYVRMEKRHQEEISKAFHLPADPSQILI